MSTHVERLQGDLDLVVKLTEEEFEDASALTTLLGVVTAMRTNVVKAYKDSLAYITVSQMNKWRQTEVDFVKEALGVELTNWELPDPTSPDTERQSRDLSRLRELLLSAIAAQKASEIRSLFRLIKSAEINLQTASLANGIYLTRKAALVSVEEWFSTTHQLPEVQDAVKAKDADPARQERFDRLLDKYRGINR